METEDIDNEGWKALTRTIRGDISRHGPVVGICPYVGTIGGKRGTGALIVYRDDYKALAPAETGADAADLAGVLDATFRGEKDGTPSEGEGAAGEGPMRRILNAGLRFACLMMRIVAIYVELISAFAEFVKRGNFVAVGLFQFSMTIRRYADEVYPLNTH